ncbi:MAG: hypothetical protein ACXVIE_08760 [Halobacteriota archaeon]
MSMQCGNERLTPHGTSPIRIDEGSVARGYRSVRQITFDLDGTLSDDIGSVVFEVSDGQSGGQGVIGTFNNYVTLKLIRFERTQRSCCIHGWFDDGKTGTNAWLLDDLVFTGILVRDANGLVGFHAGTVTPIN